MWNKVVQFPIEWDKKEYTRKTMFTGRFEHTIDVKGRVSIPSKFRETLSVSFTENLVITNDVEGCLVAYPEIIWKEFNDRVADKSRFDMNVRNLLRFYISGAQECPLDKQGRIMIPPNLRSYAGLEKDVVLVGQIKTIEIWSRDKWTEVFEKSKLGFDHKALANLGL